MALRSPADTSTPNYKGCDWYEPYKAWTAQAKTACPGPVNSAQVYGHDTWTPPVLDEDGEVVTPGSVNAVAPLMVEYGS